jgi:micrococcal nuclease
MPTSKYHNLLTLSFLFTSLIAFTPIIKAAALENCEVNGYKVLISRVIDGDTIEFNCNGKKEKIRIIGIDTPETVHPRKPVECFGPEASKKMKEFALNKKVALKKSKTSNNRGRYGRLLRYIEINGKDIGAELIKQGYAFSYKKCSHDKFKRYNQFEAEAKENAIGLWSDTCNYNDNKEIVSKSQAQTKKPAKKGFFLFRFFKKLFH